MLVASATVFGAAETPSVLSCSLSGSNPLSVRAIAASVEGATLGAQRCASRSKAEIPSVCPSAAPDPRLRARAKPIFGKHPGKLGQLGIARRVDRDPPDEAEPADEAEDDVQALEDPVTAMTPPGPQNPIGSAAYPTGPQIDDIGSRSALNHESADNGSTEPNATPQIGFLELYRRPSAQARNVLHPETVLYWDDLPARPVGPLSERSCKIPPMEYLGSIGRHATASYGCGVNL
jgi:hypothetical protein